MFSDLTIKLEKIIKRLRGQGRITEQNISEALRDARIALLEADVNYKVAKEFIESVRTKAIGCEVLSSISPGQQFIKILYEELCFLMGEGIGDIPFSPQPPTIIVIVGLQGSGKTTAAAKLAYRFKQKGKSGILIGCDIYRPAALDQLEILAKAVPVDVYYEKESRDAVATVKRGIEIARRKLLDYAIVDTAGRLHIDEPMMEELRKIRDQIQPNEIVLVADGMTGQDAVNVAKQFKQNLGIDSVILTKMDGDERGGAALSIRAVTSAPIRYIGVGEKIEALELFHSERIASRILGMGDVLTLVERAEAVMNAREAEELKRKILKDEFTLEDFLKQIKQLKKMGSLQEIVAMIPGFGKLSPSEVDDREIVKVEAIINSMTKEERLDPDIIDGGRRRRIAMGSGTKVQDVNRLLKEFDQARKMFKQMKKGKLRGFLRSTMAG